MVMAGSIRTQRTFAEGILRSARAGSLDAHVLAQTRASQGHLAFDILRRSSATGCGRRANIDG